MGSKRAPQLVKYLLTFAGIIATLWLVFEVVNYFFVDTLSRGLERYEKGIGFWMLLIVALAGTIIRWRYAKFLGLETGHDKGVVSSVAYDFSASKHLRNRENVIANVRSGYIDGVLNQSMPEQIRLNLGLDSVPNALLRPQILWEGQGILQPLETSAEIHKLFVSSGRALLILGAAGSGKTITLLELCSELLNEAANDPQVPIPVVLNLSTWAESPKPLDEWIADEMLRQYGLSKTVVPTWLNEDHLCLLLDGLDEVREDFRDKCVQVINEFRSIYSAPLTVCSRIDDYQLLAERLNLSRAVIIQALGKEQIMAYLRDPRLQLTTVCEVIEKDIVLMQLGTTPLMLNVMAVAYRAIPIGELQPFMQDPIQRRIHLYNTYIRRAFERRPFHNDEFSIIKSLRWLRYLAGQMTHNSETQFFIEDLKPDWLPVYEQQHFRFLLFLIYSILLGGLIGSLLGGLVGTIFHFKVGGNFGNVFGVGIGVLFGCILGILGGSVFVTDSENQMVDELNIEKLSLLSVIRVIRNTWMSERGVVIWTGFIVGVMGAIGYVLLFDNVIGIPIGFVIGNAFGALVGIVGSASFRGLRDLIQPVESKRRLWPNQGVSNSANNALRVGFLGAIVFGIVIGCFSGIFFGFIYILVFDDLSGIPYSMIAGILVGIVVGGVFGVLMYGGNAILQHYALRICLARDDHLPLRIVPFLEEMKSHMIIQRAGAHYRFMHRSFQEHIASIGDEEIQIISSTVNASM